MCCCGRASTCRTRPPARPPALPPARSSRHPGSYEQQPWQAHPPAHPTPGSEALRLFNAILHIIPLLVVESRKEADEVRELVSIAR